MRIEGTPPTTVTRIYNNLLQKIYTLFHNLRNHYFNYRLKKASPIERGLMMRDKFYYIGNNVHLYTIEFGTEPYLISIHDNVTCAANVKFINHDVSCFNMARLAGVDKTEVDKVGSIVLYENAFVGAYSILMPNTSVGKNSVVAAGSVVTKHIPEGEVWGGVPAKFICYTKDYCNSVILKSREYPWITCQETPTSKDVVLMRQKYFFNNI